MREPIPKSIRLYPKFHKIRPADVVRSTGRQYPRYKYT